MLLNIIGFAASAIVMVRAGSYAVGYISKIAQSNRLSIFLTSFIMIGIVSSFPEGFIAMVSSLKNESALGIGTLLGGNVADLSLVLGLIAVAAGKIKVHSKEFAHDFWLVSLVMLPVIFSLDQRIGRLEGLILISACLFFVLSMIKEDKVFSKLVHHPGKSTLKNLGLFALSSVAVLTAATFVVSFAEKLAVDFNMPLALVGVVFIGVTTTLPELMFSLSSLKRHLDGLALGDIFGTVIIDATLLTGLTALIHPISLVGVNVVNLAIFMALSLSATIYFLKPGKTFTRGEGILLILLYIIFVAMELTTSLQ